MTITTPAAPRILDNLTGLYAFEEPEDVAALLNAHPFLVPLLIEARPVIARHFGVDSPVGLRIVRDRETGHEEDTQLVVSIATDLQPVEADVVEDRFRREWWLTNLRRAQDRLVIGPTYGKRATP